MSIKILLFPALVILSVILIIGYIKPDIETILSQREAEKVKQGELENAESVGRNIQALSSFLDQKNDMERLVKRYYPDKMDQERTLDVINFLAQQTGVVINGLSMTENPRAQEVAAVSPEANADPFASSGEAGVVPQSAPELPRSYRAQVQVMGTYQNLRSFFDRLYHTDRMRVVNEFSIEQLTESERIRDGQEIIPADFLTAQMVIDFFYTTVANAGNAIHQDLFQKDSLDLSTANKLSDFVNSPVGDLAPAPIGRSNPFQANP